MKSFSFKRYWFLFRWFLIGRAHCDIDAKYKKFWHLVNNVLWFFIVVSTSIGTAHIIEVIYG